MSESDDEDYTLYGTALEPIDEDNIPRKKPISVEDQIVTDKHGRRRFHGAFTGGFSAGFFNTVGSLEGWAPSSFKSSRTNKAENHVQKPEDFMDEEDRDEFGIAPTVLRAKPEYGGSKGTKRPKSTLSEGSIPGEPVLKSILEPVGETIGVKMLMKMGWKPGQGIGPRVTKALKKKMRKNERLKRGYSCSLSNEKKLEEEDSESLDSSDEENALSQVLFAPDEKKQYIIEPKQDTFGMGYKGLDKRPVLSHINLFEPSSLKVQGKTNKLSIRGQAFGVGAFEEEDEDIYSKDDMDQYDFALESHSSLVAKKKEKDNKNKLLAISDLSDVLEGFTSEKSRSIRKKHFPPPELPLGFTPNPRKTKFETSGIVRSTARLTAEERGLIIGEIKSIDKDESKEEKPPEENAKIESNPASNSFRPFENDDEKQSRYERYLRFVRIGAKAAFIKSQPTSMTDWEKERELEEFEKAAQLYTPLSGYMAERFTSGTTTQSEEEEQKEESSMASAAKMEMFGKLTREVIDWMPCSLVCKRFNIPQPKSEETLEKTAKGKNKERLKFSVFDFLEISKKNSLSSLQCAEIKQELLESEEEEKDLKLDDKPMDLEENDKNVHKVEKELEFAFEEPKDKMDLFKAIFLSGSENESESEEHEISKGEGVGITKNVIKMSQDTFKEKERTTSSPGCGKSILANALRNTSPPRGIFANLDLDALSSKNKNMSPVEIEIKQCNESKNTREETTKESEDEVFSYGPRLPPKAIPSINQTKVEGDLTKIIDSSSSNESEEEWVERSKTKHRKHSKKHKKEKKRSRHKHKKNKK